MPIVDEKGYELLRQYHELLERVDETFTFIEQRESNEIYRVLADIFSAFMQFGKTHRLLRQHFSDDTGVIVSIDEFSDVMEEVEKLEGCFTKENMVRHLIPVFHQWKMTQTEVLAKYMVQ